ncbi:MAG: hypothetical protein Q9167_002326 [Letrouitia subvulpina]
MTLIKNRGKKGQKARLEAQKAKRLAAEALFNQDNTPISSMSSSSSHQVLPQSSQRASPCLQTLPVEILQSIFLLSWNLDFARASPRFAAAFASPHIKNEVLHMAFPTLRDPACAEKLIAEYPDDGLSELQSAVLRLKWVTFDVMREELLKSQTAYLTSQCQGCSMTEIDDDGDDRAGNGKLIQPHESSIRNFFERIQKQRIYTKDVKLQCREGLEKMIHFDNYAGMIWEEPLGEHKQRSEPRCLRPLQCGQRCTIPEKLLHGPWSDAKCDFLEFINWHGANVNSYNTSNGEVAEAGLFDAIREGNHRAVEILLNLSEIPTNYSSTDNSNCICEICAGRCFFITTRHIKAAILQGGCDMDIVHCLLDYAGRLAYWIYEDEEVNHWAIKEKVAGNRKGADLLNLLAQYSEQHH